MPFFDYDDGFAGAGSALMFCCASCGVPGVQMTVSNTGVFVKLEMYIINIMKRGRVEADAH